MLNKRFQTLTNLFSYFRLFDSPRTPKTLVSTKFQKCFVTNNNHHDENCDILAKPIHESSAPLIPTNNNNNINKPKPFPLYNKFHENLRDNHLCKLRDPV